MGRVLRSTCLYVLSAVCRLSVCLSVNHTKPLPPCALIYYNRDNTGVTSEHTSPAWLTSRVTMLLPTPHVDCVVSTSQTESPAGLHPAHHSCSSTPPVIDRHALTGHLTTCPPPVRDTHWTLSTSSWEMMLTNTHQPDSMTRRSLALL